MILVTGATGFLGSHLLYELVTHDHPVRALYHHREKLDFVRRTFQYFHAPAGELMDKIEWVKGDILDYFALTENLRGVDQVYHCAGMVSFDKADTHRMFEINVRGTAHVVNACLELNIKRLCHVSSIAALGDARDGGLIDENQLWNQGSSASPYSVSKFRGEMEVWRGIHEGLNAVIVNPSVIIGPGMWHQSGSGLFKQIYKGLHYYPTGSSGYVDVRDVVRMMFRLTGGEWKGERYIISAENLTHRQIINYLADGMNRPAPVRPLTPMLIRLISGLEKLRSLVKGEPLRLTLRSIQSATATTSYSNQKISEALSVDFLPVKESLAFSSMLFTDELKTGSNILNLR